MIRLFVPDALRAGARVPLGADQARYLTSVMRRGIGDELLVFNGMDGEWRATIDETSKKGCVLGLHDQTRTQVAPPDLDLLVALVKRDRLETIIEKAAELGARRVRLVVTRRTQSDHANVGRLQAIAAEAAEQTGRLDVPEILPPEKLDRLLDGWFPSRRLMFCDEGGDARTVIEAVTEPCPWAVLIGPEGGFAPEERFRLREERFVTPVTLGPRILRADTAAISALTLWQSAVGDWRAS
jgi:16S rRNA (uracil1498-N3)-methyltransferase